MAWLELRLVAQDGSRVLSHQEQHGEVDGAVVQRVIPRDGDLTANPDAVFEVAGGSCAPVGVDTPTMRGSYTASADSLSNGRRRALESGVGRQVQACDMRGAAHLC